MFDCMFDAMIVTKFKDDMTHTCTMRLPRSLSSRISKHMGALVSYFGTYVQLSISQTYTQFSHPVITLLKSLVNRLTSDLQTV